MASRFTGLLGLKLLISCGFPPCRTTMLAMRFHPPCPLCSRPRPGSASKEGHRVGRIGTAHKLGPATSPGALPDSAAQAPVGAAQLVLLGCPVVEASVPRLSPTGISPGPVLEDSMPLAHQWPRLSMARLSQSRLNPWPALQKPEESIRRLNGSPGLSLQALPQCPVQPTPLHSSTRCSRSPPRRLRPHHSFNNKKL